MSLVDSTALLRRGSDRPQARGEDRRRRLLEGLEHQLQRHSLADVSISAVTRHAGLGRSAFYFYFPSKNAAVAELLVDVYDELLALGTNLMQGRGEPRETMREALGHTVSLWRDHDRLFVAMLDACAADAEVAVVWRGWLGLFEDVVLRLADEQQWRVVLPSDVALREVVSGLLAMNVELLERHVRGGGSVEDADRLRTLIGHVWETSLFGSPR